MPTRHARELLALLACGTFDARLVESRAQAAAKPFATMSTVWGGSLLFALSTHPG